MMNTLADRSVKTARRLTLVVLAAGVLLSGGAAAQAVGTVTPGDAALSAGLVIEVQSRGPGGDHDRARDGVRSGDILPYSHIVAEVRRQVPGRAMDARLEGQVYVLRWQTPDNRLLDIRVDARTGRILSTR
jgi:uncharacterized membrane protein YkoI